MVCLLFATVTAHGQISVSGVAHKGVYADTVTFTVASQGGFTYTALLNTNTVPVGAVVTVNRADFYQLFITRTDGVTTNATNILFIVRASERGATEWGLPPHVPWPVIQSASAEFEGAHLRVLVPANFPAGYEIPVVAWVLNTNEHAVRANGLLSAAGQNSIQLKRGAGSGFLASNLPAGLLNYTPAIRGVATNKPVNIESPATWTNISGTLSGSTTWPENSRMRVTGPLAVPAGSTLNIGAGSIVLLNSGVNITNDGTIYINGTVEQPVVFMPNSRSQPWGGFFMRTSSGLLVASGTIFVASGAEQTGGPGHRPEQCLFLVDNSPTITLIDSAAIYLAGQFGHAYGGGAFTFNRFLLQRATTGGEYTGTIWRANDCAFIEFPDDTVNFVNGDNDALYFVNTATGGGIGFTNTLIGWTKDDGIDSGGSGYGPLRYQSCWFEATFHEGNSLSGYKDTRAWDTVYLNCGQGIEDGYDGPTGRVERCLFAANKVGARHGDNYDSIGNYNGRLFVTNSLLLWNYHDVFGWNWHTGTGNGWTQAVGQMFISSNKLTVADTNYPDNIAWNPASHAAELTAFGAKDRVGVALAVRPGQSTLANFPDGIPIGLSMFCLNEVTVDYSIDGTDGTHLAGTIHFPPGRIQNYIPAPANFSGVLQVTLSNPVNANLTGLSTLLFQNIASPVLLPLGSTWKYLDDGSEQGTAWRASAFNDSAWSNGVGRLGFGPDPAATTTIRKFVQVAGVDTTRQITNFYFRRAFVVTNPAVFTNVQFRYQRDDGCIVFLNGTQIFTNNMPLPPITANSFASTTVSGATAAQMFWTNTLAASVLQAGNNVLAVEVHQSTAGSSDIAWEMEVQGILPPTLPRVDISRLGPNAVLYWTDSTLRLEQSDAVTGGPWTPTATNSPVAVDPSAPLRVFRLKK